MTLLEELKVIAINIICAIPSLFCFMVWGIFGVSTALMINEEYHRWFMGMVVLSGATMASILFVYVKKVVSKLW